jgi:hypothetical protein
MRHNKSILLLATVWFLAVSAPTSVAAFGEFYDHHDYTVIDPAPTNIVELNVFYDYRDYGVGNDTREGAEMMTGAYFQVSAGIQAPLGLLTDYTNVLSVTATHQPTNFELNLIPDDPCPDNNFLGLAEKYWQLFLRPDSWMLSGTWEFTLMYNGSDGKRHKQVTTWTMGPTAPPVKPTYIQVNKEDGYFTVSWSGIGSSCNQTGGSSNIRYRIRVMDENLCFVQEYRAACNSCLLPVYPHCAATGTYDPISNRVTFQVPLAYEGFLLRLENQRIISVPGIPQPQPSRANQYIRLR